MADDLITEDPQEDLSGGSSAGSGPSAVDQFVNDNSDLLPPETGDAVNPPPGGTDDAVRAAEGLDGLGRFRGGADGGR